MYQFQNKFTVFQVDQKFTKKKKKSSTDSNQKYCFAHGLIFRKILTWETCNNLLYLAVII